LFRQLAAACSLVLVTGLGSAQEATRPWAFLSANDKLADAPQGAPQLDLRANVEYPVYLYLINPTEDTPRLTIEVRAGAVAVARELARRGWSVAVVEAGRIAWSASGRNTGFVLPGFAQGIDVVAKRVGLDHAKSLWALSESGLEYVRTTIQETGMPGVDLVEGGWLKVAKTDAADHDLAMVRLLGQDMGAAIEGWPADQVRNVLRSKAYFHALHFPRAFHIHPLNYALGLAAAAEQAGVRIYEGTPALTIDIEGVRKLVVTPAGTVRAFRIVLAGSVHLGGVMARVSGTLLPVWNYVATTAPLGGSNFEDRKMAACSYRFSL
jgi:glycine/D-amino acid oxidase-like deaminating enzyme